MKAMATGFALIWVTAMCAPYSAAQTGVVEEVVVTAKTGSRIGRQGDSPSPLSSYGAQDLADAGLRDIRDLVGVLAINAGRREQFRQPHPELDGRHGQRQSCAGSASPRRWCC